MITQKEIDKVQKLMNEAFIFDERTHWAWIDWYGILFKKQSKSLMNLKIMSEKYNLKLADSFMQAVNKILTDRRVIKNES